MLPHVKGKYIKLFSADDMFHNTLLEDLVNFMENNPDINFAFGDMRYIDSRGKSLGTTWFNNRNSFSLDNDEVDLLKLFFRGCSTLPYTGSIIASSALRTIILNKTCIMQFDMILWTSLLLNGNKHKYLNKIIVDYRIHENQMSSPANLKFISEYSSFEHFALLQCYLNTDNITLIRQVFEDSKYIDRLKYKDDIPFIVAEYTSKDPRHRAFGYITLLNLMENNDSRVRLEQRFGFGIKEFREWNRNAYSAEIYNTSPLRRFIQNSRMTSGGSLSFKALCVLFILKIYEQLKRKLIKENKQGYVKKRYTV
jgi:hypothetical protein